MKTFIPGFFIGLIFLTPLHAQMTTSAPAAKKNAATPTTAPAGQAPDEVVKKLSSLVHAAKYDEAQQLITGLLIAYPNDQRLIQAQSLVDKLLVSAKPSDSAQGDSRFANTAAPAQAKQEESPEAFVGIGVQLNIDPETRAIKIVSVFPHSPASKAGLLQGMIVDKIDGTAIAGKSIQEVVKLLSGAIGTPVSLGLVDSVNGETTVALTRQSIQIPNDTNPAQLSGMDKVDYNALIELARQAQQTTDLAQQGNLLQQFMQRSRQFLVMHPHEMQLWQFRAAAAISLNEPMAGYEAGQRLLAAGAADSNDSAIQQLLVQLKNKEWLDRQSAEKHAKYAKYDWLLGTWNLSWSISWQARSSYWAATSYNALAQGGNLPNVEFYITGSTIYGHYAGMDKNQVFLIGTILDSDQINWSFYLPPTSSPGVWYSFQSAYFSAKSPPKGGQTLYPSGFQPVISCEISSDKRTITIVRPSQDTDPASKYPMSDTYTYVFSKIGDTQN
ncbi:MAG TPA: PDZ domain-containing protein [Burkholderiaceae bacterium]|jgi:hypothetical protein